MKKIRALDDLDFLKNMLKDERIEREHAERRAHELEVKRQKEANLFKDFLKDVKPIPQINTVVLQAEKPPPIPLQKMLDDEQVLIEALSDEWDVERYLETDEGLSFRRNGIGQDALRKLRRGLWVVQSQIDLHGYRTDEAREAVTAFVKSCIKRDLRCVRIIHGKGLGSAGKEPVLKDKVKRWLVQKDEVLAFCQAPPRDGGAGALLVILKAYERRQR
ncbi:MAG: Smr/MutS family protein [Limnobacter sp.]|nr:Smr/MutS family protein [Limnobacter sp.]